MRKRAVTPLKKRAVMSGQTASKAPTWDLSVLYTGLDDPRIEEDQQEADDAVLAFESKYQQSQAWLEQPSELAEALREYEALSTLRAAHASYYAFYRKDLAISDKGAEALQALLTERATRRSNKLLFFALRIGKISEDRQDIVLKSAELAPYRYFLIQLFENAKYDLSEPEERILSLKADVSYGRWIQATENILNSKIVRWRGEELPLPKAEATYAHLPTKARRALYASVREVYGSVADVAESELNAIYTNKKIDDELRGYQAPYEATVRSYQNDLAAVRTLVETVSKHQDIAHRFYKIKTRLLKERKLTYADRAAEVGSVGATFSFEQAASVARGVFYGLKPLYGEIFDQLIQNRQVDVLPRRGKTGGAYCSSGITTPTFVLLNHTNSFESLKTLGHEMGHAVHAERAKLQPPLYQGHSTSTAETASTFFEYATMRRVIEQLPVSKRVIALHNILQDDIATIFRQIAFFRFEERLHAAVRRDGYVPKQRIAELMNEEMAAYLGPSVTLVPEDGNFFVTISHIRRFFYVYSYAYGQLVSKALHRSLERDPNFIESVDQFLTAGESKSPEDIFGEIGIDTRSPRVFEEGLASIAADVDRLEQLT